MDLPAFMLIHVVISVLGIIAGLVAAGGLVNGRLIPGWTGFFLATTVLTNVTGFGFLLIVPFGGVTPAQVVAGISLVVLAVCLVALYGKRLAGGWRATYAITAMIALYFNVFVLMVQLLAKIPALAKLAPQGSAAFGVSQLAVLACMAWLGRAAYKGFKAP